MLEMIPCIEQPILREGEKIFKEHIERRGHKEDGRFEMVALGRLLWDDTWKTHKYGRKTHTYGRLIHMEDTYI